VVVHALVQQRHHLERRVGLHALQQPRDVERPAKGTVVLDHHDVGSVDVLEALLHGHPEAVAGGQLQDLRAAGERAWPRHQLPHAGLVLLVHGQPLLARHSPSPVGRLAGFRLEELGRQHAAAVADHDEAALEQPRDLRHGREHDLNHRCVGIGDHRGCREEHSQLVRVVGLIARAGLGQDAVTHALKHEARVVLHRLRGLLAGRRRRLHSPFPDNNSQRRPPHQCELLATSKGAGNTASS